MGHFRDAENLRIDLTALAVALRCRACPATGGEDDAIAIRGEICPLGVAVTEEVVDFFQDTEVPHLEARTAQGEVAGQRAVFGLVVDVLAFQFFVDFLPLNDRADELTRSVGAGDKEEGKER